MAIELVKRLYIRSENAHFIIHVAKWLFYGLQMSTYVHFESWTLNIIGRSMQFTGYQTNFKIIWLSCTF